MDMEFKKIKLPFRIKQPILALGSQRKNTICFARDALAYLGPIQDDLSDPGDLLRFKKTAEFFLRKKPKIICSDLHPEYISTKFGSQIRAEGLRFVSAQHHHAHIASCMAENGLKNEPMIGVAFDGTGMGADNRLWGGEFLVCDYKSFQRAAHLSEIALIGGERSIKEPWRLLAALNLDIPKGIDKKRWQFIKEMRKRGINTVFASSMGRLFDLAACIILQRSLARFEAELAIELERAAFSFQSSAFSYSFKIKKNKGQYIIDPEPIFKQIARDMSAKVARPEIAYRFHLSVAEMIRKTCLILRKNYKINKVALSGGVFQNRLLLSMSLASLYKEGFKTIIHKKLSCNDSGISLGQAVIASLRR